MQSVHDATLLSYFLIPLGCVAAHVAAVWSCYMCLESDDLHSLWNFNSRLGSLFHGRFCPAEMEMEKMGI